MELIKSVLVFNPDNRLSIKQILQSKFFTESCETIINKDISYVINFHKQKFLFDSILFYLNNLRFILNDFNKLSSFCEMSIQNNNAFSVYNSILVSYDDINLRKKDTSHIRYCDFISSLDTVFGSILSSFHIDQILKDEKFSLDYSFNNKNKKNGLVNVSMCLKYYATKNLEECDLQLTKIFREMNLLYKDKGDELIKITNLMDIFTTNSSNLFEMKIKLFFKFIEQYRTETQTTSFNSNRTSNLSNSITVVEFLTLLKKENQIEGKDESC